MLLSEQELERMQKRFPYPRFSRAEYQRRYGNIRRMMRDLSLDCLLIIGGSAAYGRLWFNFRYVTNMMGKAEMANYCFFPKEGEPVIPSQAECSREPRCATSSLENRACSALSLMKLRSVGTSRAE